MWVFTSKRHNKVIVIRKSLLMTIEQESKNLPHYDGLCTFLKPLFITKGIAVTSMGLFFLKKKKKQEKITWVFFVFSFLSLPYFDTFCEKS